MSASRLSDDEDEELDEERGFKPNVSIEISKKRHMLKRPVAFNDQAATMMEEVLPARELARQYIRSRAVHKAVQVPPLAGRPFLPLGGAPKGPGRGEHAADHGDLGGDGAHGGEGPGAGHRPRAAGRGRWTTGTRSRPAGDWG
jgi:hypothetical protein